MNNFKRTWSMLFFLGLLLMSATADTEAQDRFVEDFSTETYNAEVFTSADWNTTAEELRLWPFETSLKNELSISGNSARNITRVGHYAYVSNGYAGVQVINLIYPSFPTLETVINTSGYVYQVHIAGQYAYVADHSGGLRILDISNNAAPQEVASLPTPEVALGLYVDGTYAYLGIGGGGLMVVDITDPLNPFQVAIFTMGTAGMRNVQVAGDYAYVTAGNDGLIVVDISDPTNPVLAFNYVGGGYSREIEIRGNYAFMSSSNAGLAILDISDPSLPFLVGSYVVTGEMRGLCLVGDRLYLANDSNGFHMIDISDPAQPVLDEVIDTPGHANDLLVWGRYAYVADFGSGLLTYEIAHATTPVLRGTFPVGGGSGYSSLSGNYLYVPDGVSGLKIVDVSDPDTPVLAATVPLTGRTYSTCVSGDLLVMGNLDEGLIISDITNPLSPVINGSLPVTNHAFNVSIHGDFVFVAAGAELQVADISDPATPVWVGSYSPGSTIRDIEIEGNLAFVYNRDSGSGSLTILDISNPTMPMEKSTYSLAGYISGMDVYGDKLLIASSTIGLIVVDISDVTNPQFVVQWNMDPYDYVTDVVVAGEHAYVASSYFVRAFSLTDFQYIWPRYTSLAGGYRYLLPKGDALVGISLGSNESGLLQVYQNEVNLNSDEAESLNVYDGPDAVLRLRINATHTSPVIWSLFSNSSGVTWNAEENTWYESYDPGPSVSWSASIGYEPGTLSVIDDVKVEWLYHHAVIESIADVPNDQGRQVSLEWTRSGHDFIGDQSQIVEYAIYRQIDSGLTNKSNAADDLIGASTSLLENIQVMTSAGWHFLTTVPVLVEDRYAVVVPTLADSTLAQGGYQSTFKVVALTATPGVFYSSYPDSGSSVDNLAPGVPQSLVASYGTDAVDLNWDEALDGDFQYFRIYRATDPNFIPGNEYLVHQVTQPAWHDAVDSAWQFHYKVTAVDFAGNESEPAAVENTSAVPQAGSIFALQVAMPNPFNPSTQINYSLAEAGQAKLVIYDIAGHLIRILVDETLPAGAHHVRWNGKNESGQRVGSGAYFSILRSGGNIQQQRMMLLK